MICRVLTSVASRTVARPHCFTASRPVDSWWEGSMRFQCRKFQWSPPLYAEQNPPRQAYRMDHAFEEPTFRFICEGVDIDYREEVRCALLEILPRNPTSFAGFDDTARLQETSVRHTVKLLRVLAKKNILSFAQTRSTPQKFYAFYEILAMCHAPLSLLAADHFTFAAFVARHGSKEVQQAVLDHVDSCNVIGAIAHRELIAEGVPLNTDARYDAMENNFTLRGAGKFAVVGAMCADWALVTATVTLNKNDNMGVHVFAVQMREGGAMKKGITVRPIQNEHDMMSASGVGVIHFDNVVIPVTSLLSPSQIVKGNFVTTNDGSVLTAAQALVQQMRLATAAIYAGILKRYLTTVVRFVAQRCVVGPNGERNYPLFGVQHVQTPMVKLVCTSYVYLALWRRVLPAFTKTERSVPSYEEDMRLAGTIYFLTQNILGLRAFADEFMGVHSSLRSTGGADALLAIHLRQEGVDHSSLIREVAFKSVIKNAGTTHWGWWLSNVFHSFAALDRFIRNPFYSPRIADLGRHLMFFGHKHYREKRRLRQSREIERRRGGSEHQWYDWVMFRHDQVLHCGEAYIEMNALEVMMDETQACTDPRARKLLRDIGWIYALARQQDRLNYFLSQQMLTPGKSSVLGSHIDNLVTVMAPQCVNLVDSFQLPEALRAPCAAEDMESYWTIPGTHTGIQRGDKVIHFRAKNPFGETKAEQEQMSESMEDFDLFHGLADKPSFSDKK
uniref:Acyl-CoA oxidase C-terminal domain-containing protein n=1 Tax=Trypanosoma congolense (strain IL3000) TaxID=1068625 RepID=G0UJI7_TRYCI|nr:conserved hypothetical protein [Trypanosoma congolense IL3000]